MIKNITKAISYVMATLRLNIENREPTESEIFNAIEKVASIIGIEDSDKKVLEKFVQAKLWINMDLGTKIYDKNTYNPWLSARKASIDPYYWSRYKEYLLNSKGWNDNIVDTLGDVSDDILNLLGNPADGGIWKRKGLILGDVQSGKTSNYIALCNKAADSGYKVIILLSGMLESLRKQTQDRVDEGFVGLNSRNLLVSKPENVYIGVSNYGKERAAVPFTTVEEDFNVGTIKRLNFTLKGFNEPIIFVVKKNKSVLDKLEKWLRLSNTDMSNNKIDMPMLLIDDEADNASVNTRKEDEDPTTINLGIKKILGLFRRSSYIAVTATPFANIFIHPDDSNDVFNSDLFPSDFIYALSPPNNYIGSEAIFGENPKYDSNIEIISDGDEHYPPRHKSSLNTNGIPLSLKEAVGYFLITNAIIDIRGFKNTHRSMLVNVSQFVNVQNQSYEYIYEYLKRLKLSIQNYSKLPVAEAMLNIEMRFLNVIFQKNNLENITGLCWEDVQFVLYESVTPIEMRLVNQKTKAKGIERLDYEPYRQNGLRVIAVGGNSLSRGLTLEGLCVSYFYRNSQMYDTLMQMGRWFGYREGYDDIFKIWMSQRAKDWYSFITMASNELRDEIGYMNKLELTPADFGLKVREHPESLLVTARNKMRTSKSMERWVSLSAKLIETPSLLVKSEVLDANLNAVGSFLTNVIEKRYDTYKEGNVIIWNNVIKEEVADLVEQFFGHPRHLAYRNLELASHILNEDIFSHWDVVIPSGLGKKIYFCGLDIFSQGRQIELDGSCLQVSGEKTRVGSRGCTKYGLPKSRICEIEKEYENRTGKNNVPDTEYLQTDRNPLLIIHFLSPNEKTKEDAKKIIGDKTVVALGLAFPGKKGQVKSVKVQYRINLIEFRNSLEYVYDEDDEYDEDW